MSLINYIRVKNAAQRIEEEALYASVVQELSEGTRREGLWAKAIAESKGNEPAAIARYIGLRVQAIRDEETLSSAIMGADAKSILEAERKAAKEAAAKSPTKLLVKQLQIDLLRAGYSASPRGAGWLVREPLGGKVKLRSDDDLIEYAKGRVRSE